MFPPATVMMHLSQNIIPVAILYGSEVMEEAAKMDLK